MRTRRPQVTKKILFVEDDQVDRLAIQRSFQDNGFPHAYEIATSIAEAKEKLAANKFDAAVVDLDLGDGTCFDIFDFIEDMPFIVVTGAASVDLAVEAMKCGASDYLLKDPDRAYLAN